MSIKRKLMLIGICIAIIVVVFTINVMRKVQEDKQEGILKDTVKENVITRAEAYRLLSYLEYNKAEREALPLGITYADSKMSDWYDSYVNAVWKMGLIEGNITIAPKAALTYGDCKQLIDNLIIKSPEYQSVYEGLSFDFSKAEEDMLIPQFLEIYQALLSAIPKDELRVTEETLFVLGREVTEDGIDRMVTDQGKYYYQDAKSYEEYLNKEADGNKSAAAKVTGGVQVTAAAQDTNTANSADDTTVTEGADNSTDKNNTEAVTNDEALVTQGSQTSLIDRYMDENIHIHACEQEIVYITSATTEKTVLHNVWIKQGNGTLVDTFVNGIDKGFTAEYKLSSSIEKVVGDITIENKKVIQISVKPDMIQGKVLRSGEDFIEIEGYGEIPLEEDYKIYKIYGTLSMEPTGSILVGYENTDFIVSGGKISAALITENIKAENIRVLIQTTKYKDIYHKKVEFTATEGFTVSSKEISNTYKAGDIVTVEPGNELLKDGRITIKTVSEEGKIQLLSIERSCGNPKYRGSIEIAEDDNGLLVINELPLEEYLYAVIPSEMPTSYGDEALKVQAVCARSYAYKHLLANSLSQYGAHVNDSVDFQVYNNVAENEDSILAVKDTYGKVIEYAGDVINALYFSTSCGHTAQASGAWSNRTDLPYLNGKLLVAEADGDGAEVQTQETSQFEDLSSEDIFKSFITSTDVTTYDSGFCWYRWKVTMSVKDIKKVIDSNLASRYEANPETVLTMAIEAKDGKEAVFESKPVDTVGNIVDITVLKRESSGMISELLISGSENTIKVRTEYNVRALLAPLYNTVTRLDESEMDNLALLPSAFFTMDKEEKNGKLNSVSITGGGYGHGVGLSQNGVKAMVDAGKTYEEIVKYFYEGTEMGYIYQ
ncbi:MAG TPA: SpoIID/LytB domain-containing protein [Mobilitalea sp.]|nr:SpoIID/LytB domain-containing protein [Mobilitalea sp.]